MSNHLIVYKRTTLMTVIYVYDFIRLVGITIHSLNYNGKICHPNVRLVGQLIGTCIKSHINIYKKRILKKITLSLKKPLISYLYINFFT